MLCAVLTWVIRVLVKALYCLCKQILYGLHLMNSLYVFSIPRSFLLSTLLMLSLICEDNTAVHSFRLPKFLFLASFKETHLLSCLQGGSFADIFSDILGHMVGISYESACPNVGIFCCTNMENSRCTINALGIWMGE